MHPGCRSDPLAGTNPPLTTGQETLWANRSMKRSTLAKLLYAHRWVGPQDDPHIGLRSPVDPTAARKDAAAQDPLNRGIGFPHCLRTAGLSGVTLKHHAWPKTRPSALESGLRQMATASGGQTKRRAVPRPLRPPRGGKAAVAEFTFPTKSPSECSRSTSPRKGTPL